MAFTTWSDLYNQMLNDFASGDFRTKSYEFDGMKKEFFSPKEFRDQLDYVAGKAADEQAQNWNRRTIARSADR